MNLVKKVANAIGYGNALKIKYFFQKPKPKEIIIDICAACNAACPFCPRLYMPEERSKGYMELELFKFILSEAKKEGIKNIRLYATAEPTLHPEFDKIIELLKEGGFYISVSTNASMIDKYVDTLLKVDVLQLSIEGWDKESYEKYRYPLKFDKIYSNIQLLHRERKKVQNAPKVSTNLLLTTSTNLDKYMELWNKYIDDIQVHFMLEATSFDTDKFISKKNEKISEEYYPFELQKDNFICGYPFNILTIAFDGKIALCCSDFSASMDMGNIKEGIVKVFESQVLNRVRKEFYNQKLDICRGCSLFHRPYMSDTHNLRKEILRLNKKYQQKLTISF